MELNLSQQRPFYLTVRPFKDMKYSESGRAGYIRHPKYSIKPSNYIRTYLLLQKDLLELLNYIEPHSINLSTCSLRIQELMIRISIEIESNFKAIFALNKYSKDPSRMTIKDYYLINASHHLANYCVKIPYWSGNLIDAVRQPFRNWWQPEKAKQPWTLSWHKDYNLLKHDKANSIHLASFENLIDAFSALTVVISAQYFTEDFTSRYEPIVTSVPPHDGFDEAIGGYFGVAFPRSYEEEEYYDFDWQQLSSEENPFVKYDYDKLVATKLKFK
jgi:hypothetical protein